MAKSSGKPKKSAPKSSRSTPKNQVVVKGRGKITVERDMIAGDQIIHGNQYNASRDMNIANVSTPREFIEQLREVQHEIAVLKQSSELSPSQVRRIEAVEGDVIEVLDEVQKPKPLPARINETLSNAQETMEKIGGSVTAAVGLGTVLGTLAQLALKIFGG